MLRIFREEGKRESPKQRGAEVGWVSVTETAYADTVNVVVFPPTRGVGKHGVASVTRLIRPGI